MCDHKMDAGLEIYDHKTCVHIKQFMEYELTEWNSHDTCIKQSSKEHESTVKELKQPKQQRIREHTT